MLDRSVVKAAPALFATFYDRMRQAKTLTFVILDTRGERIVEAPLEPRHWALSAGGAVLTYADSIVAVTNHTGFHAAFAVEADGVEIFSIPTGPMGAAGNALTFQSASLPAGHTIVIQPLSIQVDD